MKKIVSIGALAGAVALTGLAGSAYAADGGSSPAPTSPKGLGGEPVAIACVGKAGIGKLPELSKLPKGVRPPTVISGGPEKQSFSVQKGVKVAGPITAVRIDPKPGEMGKQTIRVEGGGKGIKCYKLPKGAQMPVPPGDLKTPTPAVPPGSVEIQPGQPGAPVTSTAPSGG